jgi:hypothetical protein
MKIPVLVPQDAELLVEAGQKVDFGTPFVRRGSVEEIKVPLANVLGFPPDKIFMYLHKFVGEPVRKDELLAEHKTMMTTKQYVSEYEGIIKEINHYDGSLTIAVQQAETLEMNCYFRGEIEAIDNGIITLKVRHAKQLPLQEATDHFGGKLFVYHPTIVARVTEDEIEGSVVAAEKLPTFDQAKLEALGARAFVTVHPLDEPTSPVATFRQPEDHASLVSQPFSCCIVAPDRTTIYCYD